MILSDPPRRLAAYPTSADSPSVRAARPLNGVGFEADKSSVPPLAWSALSTSNRREMVNSAA